MRQISLSVKCPFGMVGGQDYGYSRDYLVNYEYLMLEIYIFPFKITTIFISNYYAYIEKLAIYTKLDEFRLCRIADNLQTYN